MYKKISFIEHLIIHIKALKKMADVVYVKHCDKCNSPYLEKITDNQEFCLKTQIFRCTKCNAVCSNIEKWENP